MMRVTSNRGGKTCWGIIVLLCLFAVLAYFMAFNAGMTKEPATMIPYPEHWSTNAYYGLEEICNGVNSYNQSIELRKSYAKERKELNKKPFSRDNAINKLKLWKDENPEERLFKTKREKILCLMISQNTVNAHNQEKVLAHYESWGKRCDRFAVFANISKIAGIPDANIVEVHPLFGDNDNNVWQKTRLMMQQVREWSDFRTFDFVFIGGDDTYFIPENLRKMVNEPHYYYLHRNGVPFLLGHRMVSSHDGSVFVSGAGYVLNNVSAQILSHAVDGTRCRPDSFGGAEDLLVGSCLQEFGVQPMNGADEFDEDRLHCFGPSSMENPTKNTQVGSWWYPTYRIRPMPPGLGILSPYSISLHYVEPYDAKAITNHLFHPEEAKSNVVKKKE